MGDFINNILSAPVANLLIIAGIAFLGISVIGKIIGKIEPGKAGRIVAGVIGMILLIVGLLMHFEQGKIPKRSESKPSATDTIIKEPAEIPKQTESKPSATDTEVREPDQIPKPSEPKPSATDTPIKEPDQIPASSDLPDLFVSEFEFRPPVPMQGRPVAVRIGVYNKGKKRAGPFKVQWWAGENFPRPTHEWRIDSMAARGGRILNYTYNGYPSWYAQIITKVIIDPENKVKEIDKKNNIFKNRVRVKRR